MTETIAQVMKTITSAWKIATGYLSRISRISLQMQQKQPLAKVHVFPDFQDFFGTDIAIEHSALKAQTTILERREQ